MCSIELCSIHPEFEKPLHRWSLSSFELISISMSATRKCIDQIKTIEYRWCDSLLCAAPLLMVYNFTPFYHGCSNNIIIYYKS